ncbi:MAG: SPFH domain-containing protein [Acidobacteriota bacterium]
MADIRRLPFLRHLRSEPTSHILSFRNGKVRHSGRGLAFWFLPLGAAIAEVPIDDRDQEFLFSGRTRDFQEATVQGVITYRVSDAEKVASRIDFAIDLLAGHHKRQPLDQLSALLTGLAQKSALRHMAQLEIRELLTESLEDLQATIEGELVNNSGLAEMGIEVVSARLYALLPTAALEKALRTPTEEALQQQADQATFERRALAVEKERAIAENELQNQIELAKREQDLIDQRGVNSRRQAQEEAEAKRIDAVAKAERTRVHAEAQAGQIEIVESAKAEAEKAHLAAYKDLPLEVVVATTIQELKGQLSIEHLNITPEFLGPVINRVLEAGAKHLEA